MIHALYGIFVLRKQIDGNWTMMMSPVLLPILTREAVITCEACGIWLKVTSYFAQIDVQSNLDYPDDGPSLCQT